MTWGMKKMMSPLRDSSGILHTVLDKSSQRKTNSGITEIKLPDKRGNLAQQEKKNNLAWLVEQDERE